MVAMRCLALVSFVQTASAMVHQANLQRITVQDSAFVKFVEENQKPYQVGSQEFEYRSQLFAKRVKHVEQLNVRPNKTWTAGLNYLSDRSDEERAWMLGWKGAASKSGSVGTNSGWNFARVANKNPLPASHDWNHLYNMEHIRDQGACGSCWAITATTVLDAHSELYGTNRTFSTQELIECVPNPRKCGGTGGCEGATVELAFQYIATRGAPTHKENPYQAQALFGCSTPLEQAEIDSIATFTDNAAFHASGAAGLEFGMKGWQKLPENQYEPLLRALVEQGPVAVSIAANDNFMYYDSGVFDSNDCDWVLNHAVTMIGFGKDADTSKDFWQIQNSWGNQWGEDGKMRLVRHDDEGAHCGTDEQPDMGTGCDGGPTQVKVCGTCGVLYDSVVPVFNQ